MQAYSGLLAADEKVDRHGAPEPITATAPADWVAAFGGAMGVCAALFHRQRTGEGQYLTTSLLAAALTLQSPWLASVPPSDAFLVQPLLDRFAELRDAGASYAELIEARREAPRQTRAFRLYYGGYPVRDGAIILGALTPANRNQIRRALGITDDPTESDEFNALAPESGPIVDRVRAQIAGRMLSATMAEWMQRFDAEGAPGVDGAPARGDQPRSRPRRDGFAAPDRARAHRSRAPRRPAGQHVGHADGHGSAVAAAGRPHGRSPARAQL